MTPAVPPPLPPSARGRLPELDVIRGVAILGILLLNVRDFAMVDGAYWYPAHYDHFDTWTDCLVWLFGEIFWSHKFYSLLAALFGAGIVLMTESVARAGGRPAAVHYRRMAVLAVLGLLHAYLLWPGDILFHYALCGAAAYPFRKCRPLTLAITGIALVAIGLLVTSVGAFVDFGAETAAEHHWPSVDDELAILRGSWWGQFPLRAGRAFQIQLGGLFGGFNTLGLMLLGMAFLGGGWLGGGKGAAFLRRITVRCCAIGWSISLAGIALWWLQGFHAGRSWYLMTVLTIAGAGVTLPGYLAGIQWWLSSGTFPQVRVVLEAIGRTALSNYLLQSLLATFLFHGHGLALVGTLGRLEQLQAVLFLWGLQIALTLGWRKSHAQGPVESLLRRLSGRAAAVRCNGFLDRLLVSWACSNRPRIGPGFGSRGTSVCGACCSSLR